MSHAAAVTLAFVLGVIVSWALLAWMSDVGSATDQRFVSGAAFRTWEAVAGIAVVAFADSILVGARMLVFELECAPRAKPRYLLSYVAFALLAAAALLVGGGGGPDVPVQLWPLIARGLLLLGCIAAGPWVIAVWATHDRMTMERRTMTKLPTFGTEPPGPGRVADDLDQRLAELLAERRLIYRAVGHLLVLVLAAMVLSGALRTALASRSPSGETFPATDVLLYGAFFTLALGLAVIPLLRAWRTTAQQFVDRAFPPSVVTSADADAARARLVGVLDLNGSLFRSPVAIGSVLAPLVTSLLAIFIPQLGG